VCEVTPDIAAIYLLLPNDIAPVLMAGSFIYIVTSTRHRAHSTGTGTVRVAILILSIFSDWESDYAKYYSLLTFWISRQ
jgi:hypothetical protein